MMKSPIPPLLSRRLNKDGTYNIAKQANLIFVAKTDAVLIMASTASVFSSTYQSYAMHHGIPILPDHFQISKKVGHRQPTKDCLCPTFCRCSFDCMLCSRTRFYKYRDCGEHVKPFCQKQNRSSFSLESSQAACKSNFLGLINSFDVKGSMFSGHK